MEPIVMSSNQYPDRISDDGILPTLRSRMGTGGGNVPVVVILGDEPIAPILSSDSHRGGGLAVIVEVDNDSVQQSAE